MYLTKEARLKMIEMSLYCPWIRVDKSAPGITPRNFKCMDRVNIGTNSAQACHWNLSDKYRLLPVVIGVLRSTKDDPYGSPFDHMNAVYMCEPPWGSQEETT